MNRVVLTKDEAEYFVRLVHRSKITMQAASKVDPDIVGRTTFKALTSMEPKADQITEVLKAAPNDPYEFDVMLDKKQKSVLRSLINGVHENLIEKILPEYKRRNDEPKYGQYIAEAESKVQMLKAFARKLR